MIKERHGGVAAVNVATDTFPINQMPNGFNALAAINNVALSELGPYSKAELPK
jgi:hypothetical protein